MSGCLYMASLVLLLHAFPSLSYSLNAYHTTTRDDPSNKMTTQQEAHFRGPAAADLPYPLMSDEEDGEDFSFQAGETDGTNSGKSRHKLMGLLRLENLMPQPVSSGDVQVFFKAGEPETEDEGSRPEFLETSKRSSSKISQENYRRLQFLSRKNPNQSGSTLLQDFKRTGGPSLSIVNPLDVLRRQMMLDFAQRRLKENAQQIQANAEYFKKIGKRNVDSQYQDGETKSRIKSHRQPRINKERDVSLDSFTV